MRWGRPYLQPRLSGDPRLIRRALLKINATYGGTPAGEWAQLSRPIRFSSPGEFQLMMQKDAASKYISDAADLYQKVTLASPGSIARERSMFARAGHWSPLGKLEEAKAGYDDLNREFPHGTYKAVADRRLEQLGTPDVIEFYKALAQYESKSEVGKRRRPGRGKVEELTLPDNPKDAAAFARRLPSRARADRAARPALPRRRRPRPSRSRRTLRRRRRLERRFRRLKPRSRPLHSRPLRARRAEGTSDASKAAPANKDK